jgi:hypothetical protein
LQPYAGYFHRFADYELSDAAEYRIAGQDLETRRQTGGFWYTSVDYVRDSEFGAIGGGRKSPTLWLYMPDSPTESDFKRGVATFPSGVE